MLNLRTLMVYQKALRAGAQAQEVSAPCDGSDSALNHAASAREHHGLTLLPLDLNICIAAAQLPPIHDDPCDRFILATAKEYDLPVVTREQYGHYGVPVIR
jgi:PIN domain nuclease of toxin-antitoxin system